MEYCSLGVVGPCHRILYILGHALLCCLSFVLFCFSLYSHINPMMVLSKLSRFLQERFSIDMGHNLCTSLSDFVYTQNNNLNVIYVYVQELIRIHFLWMLWLFLSFVFFSGPIIRYRAFMISLGYIDQVEYWNEIELEFAFLLTFVAQCHFNVPFYDANREIWIRHHQMLDMCC